MNIRSIILQQQRITKQIWHALNISCGDKVRLHYRKRDVQPNISHAMKSLCKRFCNNGATFIYVNNNLQQHLIDSLCPGTESGCLQ